MPPPQTEKQKAAVNLERKQKRQPRSEISRRGKPLRNWRGAKNAQPHAGVFGWWGGAGAGGVAAAAAAAATEQLRGLAYNWRGCKKVLQLACLTNAMRRPGRDGAFYQTAVHLTSKLVKVRTKHEPVGAPLKALISPLHPAGAL
jgi:hypothetical protein